MSINNSFIIDGIAINDKEQLVLLITDHLNWDYEYRHLCLLQDKINSYCSYCENKQYENVYSDCSFRSAIIEIHFLHEPTINARNFLSVAQSALAPEGIAIECHVDEP